VGAVVLMNDKDKNSMSYGGPERRAYPMPQQRSWADIWLTPTALVVLLGGITWGVQLNLAVGHLTEDVAAIETKADSEENRVDEISDQLLRITLILERIEKRMDSFEERE
jgi:hypothetical protein